MEQSLKICSIDVVTEANQDNQLLPRQVAVDIDDDLTVTMQLCDNRLFSLAQASAQEDAAGLAAFKEKFDLLSRDELAASLRGTAADLGSATISAVGCVGCRRAVEAFLSHVGETGEPALDPVQVRGTELSLRPDWFTSSARLYYLLEVVRRVLECRVDSGQRGAKSKKAGKRCAMHGLDAHKSGRASWKELWDVMSAECRAELGLVSFESLEDTLDAHLVRHKFCRECRAKVERAFAMLLGDEPPDATYKPAVFAFVRVCKERGHVHLLPEKADTATLYQLVDRAEPELLQSNPRERHAQTMDAAQEEVLTCIGLHLYNRLAHLAHTLRSDEQTWLLALLLCLERLRRGLESAVEAKRGFSSLDLFYWQLQQEEKTAELRRVAKREKRRQKRQNKRQAAATTPAIGVAVLDCPEADADAGVDVRGVTTEPPQQPQQPEEDEQSPRSSASSGGGVDSGSAVGGCGGGAGGGGGAASSASSSCSASHNSSGFSEEECAVRRMRRQQQQQQQPQQQPQQQQNRKQQQQQQQQQHKPSSSSQKSRQQRQKQPKQQQQQHHQQCNGGGGGGGGCCSDRSPGEDSGCEESPSGQGQQQQQQQPHIPADVVEDFLKHKLEIERQREELRRRLRQQWAEKVNSSSSGGGGGGGAASSMAQTPLFQPTTTATAAVAAAATREV